MGNKKHTHHQTELTFKMRLLLIATSLALAAAAPHSEDRQKWRPAQGRDLSKFKPKLPEVAFGTPSAPRTVPKQFESKKGNKSFAEECGLENPNGIEDRIVGGHEAAHHEWPWQVALFIDDAWFCGGSLISDEWVMTAAHCADGASYFDIMAGAHNVRDSSEPHRIEITSFEGQTHPEWDSNSLLRRHCSCAPAREGGFQRVHQTFLSSASVRRERAICWAADHASWMGEERRQCWRDHSRPQYGFGSSSDKPRSLRRLLRQHHLQRDHAH